MICCWYSYDGNTLLSSIEMYDQQTETWQLLESNMSAQRCDAGLTVVRQRWNRQHLALEWNNYSHLDNDESGVVSLLLVNSQGFHRGFWGQNWPSAMESFSLDGKHWRQSWVSWAGSRPLRFWDWGLWGSPWNIIISYNVQEYEMGTLSKVVTFQK